MKEHKLCENDDEMAEWITGPYPSEKDLQESSEKMAATFTWDRCADAFLQASSEKAAGKTRNSICSMEKAEYNQFQRCTCMDLEQMRRIKGRYAYKTIGRYADRNWDCLPMTS